MQAVLPVTHLIQQARQGVLRARVDEVAALASLSDKEMAHVLNMSVRGLHGKTPSEVLSLAASERLLLLERLLRHSLNVFDGRSDLVSRWLHTPLPELAYAERTEEPGPTLPLRSMGSFEAPVAEAYSSPATSEQEAQSPLAVLDTVSGFALAEDVLGRIEWGIIS